MKKIIITALGIFLVTGIFIRFQPVYAQNIKLEEFDQKIRKWAFECKKEVIREFNRLLDSKTLTKAQLFDTFYIPIPNTYPPKYHTQYDKYLDKVLRKILDKYYKKSKRIAFVVAVDRNGYLPTHNTRYSQPLTGDRQKDLVNNRTKRIFNDKTGLAAARNTQPYLLQRYFRDTGEVMYDMSVPIFIKDRHWGAIRIGYK